MAVDLSVFDRVKTVSDYDRAEQEFQLKKLLLSHKDKSTLPAALQIADAYAQARDAGDIQRMNDIAIAAKSFDKGVTYDPYGNPIAMAGYGDAVGSIEGAKAGYKEQAQKDVDLTMNPQITRAESDQRNLSDLNYSGPIKTAETLASGRAQNVTDREDAAAKKTVGANASLNILNQAEALLPKASGGVGGSTLSYLKGAAGYSDETTQTNEKLKLLSGWLVSNVPRMEGPQSDFDVQNYRTMAADLGNTMKPIGDRLAALQGLRSLQEKYANPEYVSEAGNLDFDIPPIDQEQLNGGYQPAAPNPGPVPLSLYQQSEQQFNAKKSGSKQRLKYNPATGEFE